MKINALLVLLLFIVIQPSNIFAHCEIPCGIYGDKMRIETLKEHVNTIEKSMDQIISLQDEDQINYNQLVRWITNKDEHASLLQEIVTQYFLTQRIKFVDDSDSIALKKYQDELTILHQMLIYAMKTKQTTNLEYCKKLRLLIDDFYNLYFTDKEKSHHHN